MRGHFTLQGQWGILFSTVSRYNREINTGDGFPELAKCLRKWLRLNGRFMKIHA